MKISFKDWKDIYKMAKTNNINTIGELVMYCKVWNINNGDGLYIRLAQDYLNLI